jgi:predicted nucleic acid-binding protein
MLDEKISLYLDTSVFGGYYDNIFERDTCFLFSKIKQDKYNVFVSDLTEIELINAPEKVRTLLHDIEFQSVVATQECKDLADKYISENVVGATSKDDCIHIATATVNKIDVLVSWNFKHIVNIPRIKNYNLVNTKNGYENLIILSPKDRALYELG